MVEIWESIPDFPHYQISNFGRVKRLEKNLIRKGLPYKLPEKILRVYSGFSGYLMIQIRNENQIKTFLIHRLVAMAFIANPRNLEFVNHIDNNKLNNHVTNLEWVTKRENSCHVNQLHSRFSSKFTGVAFHQKSQKWYASIRYNGKSQSLGYHNTEEAAYEARCKFEKEHGIVNKYL